MGEIAMKRPHRGQGAVAAGTVLAATLLAGAPCAFGLNSELHVSQFAHTSWKVRDGFVKGTISAIAQTPDGYLWLGTEFGLVRFDGIRTVAWQPPDQHLPSNHIFSLLVGSDGTLWIGTSKGLASWKDGRLSQYPALAGQTIRAAILQDHEGTVWAGGLTSPSGRLCAIRQGGIQCYGEDGSLGTGVSGLYEDRNRNLWVGVSNGLWRWNPGPAEFFPTPVPAASGGGIQGMVEGDEGSLLFGGRGGITRLSAGKIEPYPLPGPSQQFTAIRMLRDPDRNLWIGTSDAGLVYVHHGSADVFTQADGLSGDFIEAIFVDREGTVWVATDAGLDRFREVAAATLSLSQGLSNASVLSVLADRDGSIWLSTRRGLNRWRNGQITIFGKQDPRGDKGQPAGLLNGNYAGSMFQDSRGRIWASTLREFGYLENDRFVALKSVPGGAVYSIAEDASGDLWIANKNLGLIQLSKDGKVEAATPWTAMGHKDPAMAIAPDPARHGLWIGFQLGGILLFADGQVRASYSAANGLGEGRVNGLKLDRDGALWAATEGGLSRLNNGRAATLTTRNGLPCDPVHWVLEDDSHSFWLYTTCGLVQIARSELEAWAAAVDKNPGLQPSIRSTLLDSTDGVRSLEDNGGYTPHAAKASDGRIWFLPSDGASVVDPRHLPFNRLPPPVHIEQITADRKTYDGPFEEAPSFPLPALIRDLKIDYTALSLVAPERVRFRYKLEGWDTDWQEVTNQRQAFYSNLPPRDYRFRVAASNNSGVWNEAGAAFAFSIAPAFYQAAWFRLLCVAAVLALLWGGYRWRLRQLAWQFQLRMEERINERTRIARDLHDTLLQSFQGVLMKFSACSYRFSSHPEIHQELDAIVAQAQQAINEGRDAVQGLRSFAAFPNEMAQAIRSFGEELATGLSSIQGGLYHPEFRVQVEGDSREIAPIVRDEIYRIACEAVRNARQHAAAGRIDVMVQYAERQFRLCVRDDGKGIDPKILRDGQSGGHHGLQGMKERAKLVGGKLTLWSRPESGTEVDLVIPGAIAYVKQAAPRWSMSLFLGRRT